MAGVGATIGTHVRTGEKAIATTGAEAEAGDGVEARIEIKPILGTPIEWTQANKALDTLRQRISNDSNSNYNNNKICKHVVPASAPTTAITSAPATAPTPVPAKATAPLTKAPTATHTLAATLDKGMIGGKGLMEDEDITGVGTSPGNVADKGQCRQCNQSVGRSQCRGKYEK
jgi:hypothetical protein